MKNLSKKNLIIIALLIVCGLLGGRLIYLESSNQFTQKEDIISVDKATSLALSYVNKNILPSTIKADLIEKGEENGVYKLKLKIEGNEFLSYITKDGVLFFPQGINLKETQPSFSQEVKEKKITIGNFLISKERVCQENDGKPIIYFFGAQWCPHCQWEHPIINEVVEEFKNFVSFHDNMGKNKEREIFEKFSEGGIPTIVIGCRYYRVGSGENLGEDKEKKILKALICKLTKGQPQKVCSKVQDLINQIYE